MSEKALVNVESEVKKEVALLVQKILCLKNMRTGDSEQKIVVEDYVYHSNGNVESDDCWFNFMIITVDELIVLQKVFSVEKKLYYEYILNRIYEGYTK